MDFGITRKSKDVSIKKIVKNGKERWAVTIDGVTTEIDDYNELPRETKIAWFRERI